jgi:hypothetical protein
MLRGRIPARSDGRSSQYSLGLGGLDMICERSLYPAVIFDSHTVVWWRFPYQRAGGTISEGDCGLGIWDESPVAE